jgi:hypothetical protein
LLITIIILRKPVKPFFDRKRKTDPFKPFPSFFSQRPGVGKPEPNDQTQMIDAKIGSDPILPWTFLEVPANMKSLIATVSAKSMD